MNTIVTVHFNPPDYALVTLRRMKDYAERIGVSLTVIRPEVYTGNRDRGPLYKAVLTQFDRVLFIDYDCVISRNAPDIFAQHEAGKIWMVRDSGVNDLQCANRFDEMVKLQAVMGSIGWYSGYGNAGVMLMESSHENIFDDWLQIPNVMQEQGNINYQIHKLGYEIGWMDFRWNFMGVTFGLNSNVAVGPMSMGHIAHIAGFPGYERPDAITKLDELMP